MSTTQQKRSWLSRLVAAPAGLLATMLPVAKASDDSLHAPSFPWSFRLPWQAYDTAAIRRGFKVYQQVCATCHGLEYVAYRNLVNVAFTEDEVKAIAAEVEVDDLDDKGEVIQRPAKLTDYLPSPYPNPAAARAANAGALPPDLSLIVKARPGGADYLFSLLTGYHTPPVGTPAKEGLYYNPYFAGSWVAMPPPLTMKGQVDYDDNTEAHITQMAKDVTTFLAWAAEPHQDEHKLLGLKLYGLVFVMGASFWYYKRLRWSIFKTRVLDFIPAKKHGGGQH